MAGSGCLCGAVRGPRRAGTYQNGTNGKTYRRSGDHGGENLLQPFMVIPSAE